MDNLGSFPCLILFVQFLVSYRRLLASICKENANERKENLFSICRVQLFFCKVTTFPRNFQGFWENIARVVKKKTGDSGMESRLLNIVVSMMKQRIIYSLLISSICFIISSLVFCIFRYIHHAATTPMKAPVPPP